MAISGGAVWPSVVYAVDMTHTDDPRYSIRVTTGLYAVAMLWPLALSSNRTMRRWIDPVWSRQRLAGTGNNVEGARSMDWPTPDMNHAKVMASHLEVTVEEKSCGGSDGEGERERKRSVTFGDG